jgi:hypothetical protein
MNDAEFFKKEYELISNAHFNVSERVTSFFRYILLIYSAPLILFTDRVIKENNYNIRGCVFVLISIVGLFIMLYISQLRIESILYARTVNGIRKLFYDNEKDIKLFHYSVLPIQKEKPSFYDGSQFIWIIITIALIDTAYSLAGIYFLSGFLKLSNYEGDVLEYIIIGSLYFILHILCYISKTDSQEKGTDFFKSSIGVDIDGVLNEHEIQFCKIIRKL